MSNNRIRISNKAWGAEEGKGSVQSHRVRVVSVESFRIAKTTLAVSAFQLLSTDQASTCSFLFLFCITLPKSSGSEISKNDLFSIGQVIALSLRREKRHEMG